MKEQDYQTKIIKAIEAIGGVAINGNFTKAGTADLICGWPVIVEELYRDKEHSEFRSTKKLLHVHVEVKTKYDYARVFRSIYEDEDRYIFNENTKSLKEHEYLQITKLNSVRNKGGLALIAYSFEQVERYVNANK